MKHRVTLIDRIVGYVNPVAGLKRTRARFAQQALSDVIRRYEGASSGRRTDGWYGGNASTSANAEIMTSLPRLRDRSRDLVRNNPYVAKAISVISSNVVGTGIVAQIKNDNASRALKMQQAWKSWAESTDCDFDGKHNLYGLQQVAMRSIAEGGEAVVIRRRTKAKNGKIPLQIQVLEGDFIDHYRQGESILSNGGWIIQGVEFDANGRVAAYWIWSQHPGESLVSPRQRLVSERVLAEDVLHVFRTDRLGQVRGVPWGAPVVLRARDFDEYEDAQLMRQKIAACFAGFIQDIETPIDITANSKAFPSDIEPGALEILPPGKSVTFPNVPQVTDDGHAARMLRSIAAGFGITYESLTGDLSNVNFSSGRMGWIEMGNNVAQWQWGMFIPQFCGGIFNWWADAAMLAGLPADGTQVSWTAPARQMIDPAKEVAAKRDEIRAGLTSLSEAIREQGRNPEELFAEMERDNATLDRLKIKLDCDPRYLARGGTAQSMDQGGQNAGEGTKSSTPDDADKG